ncbi:MAG TPA: hypothetical protein DEA80_16355 [Afipia sp.]|nr:hypothetical protein [Afipia sp.]OUX62332.1 MAG: hypothetical protein CBB64_04290 [Afipia sp. TMED4]HAQ93821.1 hypothetical protein [Afipia sp.]HBF53330.1 hypothetical protein [Afipia sp.]HBR46466.1 hypothetical protein [Afipia sp.]|tara:strand:+ start:243 stop:1001 length:759 start_codon:yes stop_codon:yes gene_type:complete
MLQLPETATAENSAVITDVAPRPALPSDVGTLIKLHRYADESVNSAKTDAEMQRHNESAHTIYRALISATPTSVAEEAERLTYILGFLKDFLSTDGQIDGGWLDIRELSHIAKNLTKLSKPVGPSALNVVSKNHQPLSRAPEPSLKAQLDHMASEGDVEGMVALYDYFIALNDAATFSVNQPRSASIELFISADSGRHCARAYAVADRLKQVRSSNAHAQKERARVLVEAAFFMGGSLQQAADLLRALAEGN